MPRIELTVTGIPDLRAGERVRKAVEAVYGVSKLTVAQAGRGVMKLVFETAGRTPRGIALDLDGTSGLGVVVIGYGPAGQTLTRLLRAVDVPYVVIDTNARTVRAMQARPDSPH